MAVMTASVVVPGDAISQKTGLLAGSGTHVFASTVQASIAGLPNLSSTSSKPPSRLASVLSTDSTSTLPSQVQIPSVGDTVFGRVTRTTPRQATIDILALGTTGSTVLPEPFQALIRQQDIRATEIDKVKISESFRVGDVVRGLVISLGDERNYYVSTARNEFGVVLAVSSVGRNRMVPVSWKEMRDMQAGVNELRKVAKVV